MTTPSPNAPEWRTTELVSVLAVGGAMMQGNRFADTTMPAMREHYAGCRKIALVLHATHPDDRDAMEAILAEAFAALGDHEAISIHRGHGHAAIAQLLAADAFFVGGGETFGLLRALHETGQLELIRNRVLDGVPYAGSSAGANMTGLVIGATNDFPVTDIPTRRALGLLPVVINPHHPRADETESHEVRSAKIQGYLKWNPGERVLALGDRAMVRLHDGQLRVKLGPVWDYTRTGRIDTIEGQLLGLR